jgi:ABC-type multidrug transport system ATPase subunit/peptidoglycan/LPS O-acetylase OafA/YrhL
MKTDERLHALDSVRGFALLLGVAFHAAISFVPGMIPGIWAIVDSSTSAVLSDAAFVTHIFRMSLFFFIAGFFARMLYQRAGAGGFWSNRLKRIAVPLLAGWIVVFPAIAWVWSVGIRKAYAGAAPPVPMSLPDVPAAFPLSHLWFLYYLLLLYMTVLGLHAAVVAIDRRGAIRAFAERVVIRMLRGYTANFVLGLPLAACLLTLPFWVYWQGIPTPDHSLIPQSASFVGYGTALVFGWLVHRASGALAEVERRWLGHLSIAISASAVCVWILHSQGPLTPVAPGSLRTTFVLAFVVAQWSWVFAITGVALRFFGTYSSTRRYIADASYWIYIVHLPLVAALQVLVAQWPLHWSMKFPFVVAVSLALLLTSYHYLIRPTFVGELLNGRKYPHRPQRGRAVDSRAIAVEATSVAELRDVSKNYQGTPALSNVDLKIARGQLVALLGPNGAGKTTAISLWLGLIEPDRGSATIVGGSPLEVQRRRKIGVMMQDVELPRELCVRELIALSASYYPNPLSLAETLALTNTTALANRMYGKLSGGQKRQVQFAMALCGRPELLFLDEPTAGLDIQARKNMWTVIRELLRNGCSIILTTHYLEEAEALADRVVVLAKGRVLADGSVDAIRSVVSRRLISCESSVSVDEVSRWPGVITVSRDTALLHITVTDAEDIVRRLLANDGKLRQLEVRHAGLNEAFAELTKEAA